MNSTIFKRLVGIFLIAGIPIVAILYYWGHSDKNAVARQFYAIVECVEKTEGEGNITMVAKHQKLARLLAPDVRVVCTRPDIDYAAGSDEMLSQYVPLRKYCKAISITHFPPIITIAKDGKSARLSCSGKAVFTLQDGRIITEKRSAIVTFIRQDKTWLAKEAREDVTFKP